MQVQYEVHPITATNDSRLSYLHLKIDLYFENHWNKGATLHFASVVAWEKRSDLGGEISKVAPETLPFPEGRTWFDGYLREWMLTEIALDNSVSLVIENAAMLAKLTKSFQKTIKTYNLDLLYGNDHLAQWIAVLIKLKAEQVEYSGGNRVKTTRPLYNLR